MKDWNLLKGREIISMMIGDVSITNDGTFVNFIMPYMRGVDICDFANSLGLNMIYNEEKLSRKEYMERTLNYVIENNKINEFFQKLFELKRFRGICNVNGCNKPETYWRTISEFMIKLNEILYYSKCHIEYNLDSYIFSLVDDESEIVLNTEVINKIDIQYIKKNKRSSTRCY